MPRATAPAGHANRKRADDIVKQPFRSVCQGQRAEILKKSGCVQFPADKTVDFVAHGFPAGGAGDRHAGVVGHRLSFHRSSKLIQRDRHFDMLPIWQTGK